MESDSSEAYEWPETHSLSRKLESLENELLCPICQGYINNPHMLKCGHSYCSICIRKHFDKTLNRTCPDVCPSCKEKADTYDLRKNTALANVVRNFKSMRKDLLGILMKQEQCSPVDYVKQIPSEVGMDPVAASGDTHGRTVRTVRSDVPILKRLSHYSFHGMGKDKVKRVIEQVTSEASIKLRTDGDKDILEKRLRELVHLINAQVDSDRPMTMEQVIRQINANENRSDMENFASCRTSKKLERAKNGEVVPEINNGFTKLIQQIKNNGKGDKKEETCSNNNKSNNDNTGNNSSTCSSSCIGRTSVEASAIETASSATDPAGNDTEDTAAGPAASCWGPWRSVMSNALQRPFFFNTETGIGQFECPSSLRSLPAMRQFIPPSPPPLPATVPPAPPSAPAPVPHQINDDGDNDAQQQQQQQQQQQGVIPMEKSYPESNEQEEQQFRLNNNLNIVVDHRYMEQASPSRSCIATHLPDGNKSQLDCDILVLDNSEREEGLALEEKKEVRPTASAGVAVDVAVDVDADVTASTSSSGRCTDTTRMSDDGRLDLDTRLWSCTACTYLNSSIRSNCEMCGMQGPSAKVSRMSNTNRSNSTGMGKAPVSYDKNALYSTMLQNSRKLGASQQQQLSQQGVHKRNSSVGVSSQQSSSLSQKRSRR